MYEKTKHLQYIINTTRLIVKCTLIINLAEYTINIDTSFYMHSQIYNSPRIEMCTYFEIACCLYGHAMYLG
jgi:hypothetical protein